MNELQLSKSDLLAQSENKNSPSWMESYAADVWQNPTEHKAELTVGAIAVASAVLCGGLALRKVMSHLDDKKIGSMIGEATLTKTTAPPAERFYRMSDRDVKGLLTDLEKKHGIQLSSWGRTKIEGTENPNIRVLRSANGDALKVQQGDQVLFAHKVNTSTTGDTTFSYYTRAPFHLKNPWIGDESAAWPLKAGGPLDGLRTAGIDILDLQKPRGFHYSPDLNTFSVKWTEMRATVDPKLASSLSTRAGTQEFGEISVSGKNAAINGNGVISIAAPRFQKKF